MILWKSRANILDLNKKIETLFKENIQLNEKLRERSVSLNLKINNN